MIWANCDSLQRFLQALNFLHFMVILPVRKPKFEICNSDKSKVWFTVLGSTVVLLLLSYDSVIMSRIIVFSEIFSIKLTLTISVIMACNCIKTS